MNKHSARVCTIIGLIPLAILAGCSTVSQTTKDSVARAESVVAQVQQTIGNSENGAIELQTAKNNLDAARQAVKDGEENRALWMAHEATLNADLATAKARTAGVRKVADEVQASIQTLRQEAARPLR